MATTTQLKRQTEAVALNGQLGKTQVSLCLISFINQAINIFKQTDFVHFFSFLFSRDIALCGNQHKHVMSNWKFVHVAAIGVCKTRRGHTALHISLHAINYERHLLMHEAPNLHVTVVCCHL